MTPWTFQSLPPYLNHLRLQYELELFVPDLNFEVLIQFQEPPTQTYQIVTVNPGSHQDKQQGMLFHFLHEKKFK